MEFISAFFGGFARIFLFSLVFWMIGLIILLFREMFNTSRFDIRKYLYTLWRMTLLVFEIVGYGAVVVGIVMLFSSEEKLTYGMVTFDALLLSALYLYLRFKAGGWSAGNMRMRRERNSRR